MNNNDWPLGVTLEGADAEKINGFIERQMANLAAFDARRAAWVHDNMPAGYRMTYVFSDHARRVAHDMKMTALYLGLPATTADILYRAMLPHDIGKQLLPIHIWDTIEKPENDTKTLRRSHTELGITLVDEALKGMQHPFIDLMKDIMLNHHEQMDGGGFLGRTGADLSASVRLACIVESFDGYSTVRPHFGNRDISVEGVLRRMREEKGAALYDMGLFEAFAAMKMQQTADKP